MAGETGQTTSRLLNRMAYDIANKATDIGTAATGDFVLIADVSDDYEVKYGDGANLLEMIGSTVSAAELNYLDITTLGTGAASKAVVLDASGDYTYPSTATIVYPSSATLTLQSGSTFNAAGTVQIGGVGMTASAAELNYLDITTLGTGAASKAVVLDAGDDYTWPASGILTYGVLKDPAATTITSTGAEINKLDDSVTILTPGAGVSAAETNKSGYFRNGGIITTSILVDLTGLVGSATDLDIIGNTGGAASAHFGQITAALNGTIAGGTVTCLEVPAGGADDIDFYSATVSTGAQDVDVTTLTETVLLTRGAAWVAGDVKAMSGFPPANDYLYIVNGEAVGGTYTAGKFLIEFYGV